MATADGSLSVSFLSEYAATVQIDYQHALSRTIRADKHAVDPKTTYEVLRPKLNRDALLEMMKERIRLQNMCSTGNDWNVDLNRFLPWTCVTFFAHRAPRASSLRRPGRYTGRSVPGPWPAPVSLVEVEADTLKPTPITDFFFAISLKTPRDSN